VTDGGAPDPLPDRRTAARPPSHTTVANEVILEVRDVTKSFGGLTALAGVSLELRRGEVLGLIGPNGAGKTTLFNVVAGAYHADFGSVRFKGTPIDGLRPHDRCRLGIARTFQITKPFLGLTVLENVMVGAHFGHRARATMEHARARAQEALETVHLASRAETLASALTIGERKRLEMARALATDPEVLLLDEVVAGLSPTEVDEMMDAIRRLNAGGRTILIIEHVMRAVMGVSSRVIVLHYGRKLAEGTPAQVVSNEEVIAAYLGGHGRA
jgi:branched-chain amino acid transport system ATP-binding protein